MTPTLSSIHIYPVKAAGGITLERWTIDAFGPRYDRRWMMVDEHGVFLSQRSDPSLALIRTELDGDRLVLHAPSHGPIELPLEPDWSPGSAEVRVWNDTVVAESCGAAADRWLTSVLGRRVRLVRMPDDALRQVDLRFANPGERTSFTDAFPFLLIGSASLADLNARLEQPLPMNRFRPNLVIEGTLPFEEDEWLRIGIGNIEFRVAKPCARCVVTTTDQETGARGVEPLRTLATYRRRDGKVLFGQNLVHEGMGYIEVGTPVDVMETRPT